jgi:hypothetical protein
MRFAPLVWFFCLPIVFGLAIGCLDGCSSTPRSAPPAVSATSIAPRAIHVGEVKVVDERKRFVLVDLQSNLYVPEQGVTLRTMRNATQTAKVKVAPERKLPFIAADVIEGNPAVGDEVLQ